MVNRTCSNISLKNCQQVCVLIQTPYNKKILSLCVSFCGVYVGSWMVWYRIKSSILRIAAAERKSSYGGNKPLIPEVLPGVFTCSACLWAINMFIYKLRLFHFFLKSSIFIFCFTWISRLKLVGKKSLKYKILNSEPESWQENCWYFTKSFADLTQKGY